MLDLKKLLTKALDSVTLKTITVTPQVGTLISNFSCKLGRLHVISFRIDNVTTTDMGFVVASIPTGYAPPSEVPCIAQIPSYVGNATPYGWINTSAVVRVGNTTGGLSNASIRIVGFYYK